ncbi:MAG: hypothetical protein AAB834_08025 [Patescibacteria group bacterium]
MRRTVVAISHPSDEHLPFVQAHLAEPMIVIDQIAVIAGDHLAYELNGSGVTVVHKGRPIRNISGVWYRRPEQFSAETLPVPSAFRDFSSEALREFSLLLRTRFAAARWVSDVFAIRRAEDKVLQLEQAAKLGFKTLPTLVSSSAEAARSFIKTHRSVVAKPLNVPFFEQNQQVHGFYTTRVTGKTDLSGLHVAPCIFQVAIDPVADIRVTVVGNDVFAAVIHEHDPDAVKAVRDWRIGYYHGGIQIDAFDLPAKIVDLCRQHVKALGLQFGAIDLVLDKKGTFWFLENNPNGQWAFVEEETGQPIGNTLAKLLSR